MPKIAAAVAIEEPTATDPKIRAFLPLGVDRVESHEEEEPESEDALEEDEEEITEYLDTLMMERDAAEKDLESEAAAEEPETEESDDVDGFEIVKRDKNDEQWEEEPRKDGKLGEIWNPPLIV